MSKGHNKKRNIGIVYEQLVATASACLVEGKKDEANKAVRIIKKYFRPGTEIYKEYRLFNALTKTHVKSDALASRILEDTKSASSSYSLERLRSEKSNLINEINRTFNKDDFYNTPVKNYKLLATIHTLMEEWRSSSPDVMRRAQYESRLHEWLTSSAEQETLVESMKTSEVNDLTVKIMRSSFNKKFGNELNERQKDLIKSLVFEGDKDKVSSRMHSQKRDALHLLERYKVQCDSKHVVAKIPQVVTLLESLDAQDTSDTNIAKFLTVAQLCDELMENSNV
jgi:hypothetical protein